ncbi:MAG: hypothetical protein AB1640_04160 [bacterium]
MKKMRLVLCVGLFSLTACGGGGGSVDPADLCETVEPCTQVGCTTCDWPEGSCRIGGEQIYSIDLASAEGRPYTIILDVLVSSVMRSAEDRLCSDPEILIGSPQGELVREGLALDRSRRVCAAASAVGRHTVSLLCDAYPTRAGYRVTVVDASGRRVR